jgi:hypothetical protein
MVTSEAILMPPSTTSPARFATPPTRLRNISTESEGSSLIFPSFVGTFVLPTESETKEEVYEYMSICISWFNIKR